MLRFGRLLLSVADYGLATHNVLFSLVLYAKASEQVISAHPVSARATSSSLSLLLNLWGLVLVRPLLDPLIVLCPLPLLPLFAFALAALFLLAPCAFPLSPLLGRLSSFTVTVTAVAVAVSIPVLGVPVAGARSPPLPVTVTVAVTVAVALTVVPAMTIAPVSIFPVAVALSSRRR